MPLFGFADRVSKGRIPMTLSLAGSLPLIKPYTPIHQKLEVGFQFIPLKLVNHEPSESDAIKVPTPSEEARRQMRAGCKL